MNDFSLLLSDYENTKLVHYDNALTLPGVVAYDQLSQSAIEGVLKACTYVDGRLMQVYSEKENHVAVIAGTRLGKTTSYVIPTILSFARQRIKKSMIISDPKGEIYRHTSATLKQEGYNILLLNFRDCMHSECWNVLTPIFRKYKSIQDVYDEVQLVEIDGVCKNEFRGVVYDNQIELDEAINQAKEHILCEVSTQVNDIGCMFIPTVNTTDPYWEDSAREMLKAFIWAMLEDSNLPDDDSNKITEDTFSFKTIVKTFNTFCEKSSYGDLNYDDKGYFSSRGKDSIAFSLFDQVVLHNASTTRRCVLSIFVTKMATFNDIAVKMITSCNTFEIQQIVEQPTAIYIDYRDEIKSHYQLISLFVQNAYKFLIEEANDHPNGKLDTPFYFILDEFGNFPLIKDFDTTISACAGRNIFFILIIQSYAQLNNVYGKNIAEIIKDNLNMHIFFGSNNPDTLQEFSNECGKITRISPISAINGTGSEIDTYQLETIPLIPISRLSHFKIGECIITEANSGYVMLSKLERYFQCTEFADLPTAFEKDYVCPVNLFSSRYNYNYTQKPKADDKSDDSIDYLDDIF
ncbi:MAG: type IV secretory system conjugative DNA transfer family protein [Christensenellales bacterium]